MATLNISLTDKMRAWIDARVASGDYANASDYVRDLIRHDEGVWTETSLRQALLEGEQSGYIETTMEEILKEAHRLAEYDG